MSHAGMDSCGLGWRRRSSGAKIRLCWRRPSGTPVAVLTCGRLRRPSLCRRRRSPPCWRPCGPQDGPGGGGRFGRDRRHPAPWGSGSRDSAATAVPADAGARPRHARRGGGVLRKVGSSSSPSGGRVDPAVAMALLHQAAVQHQDVLMGYVDAAGSPPSGWYRRSRCTAGNSWRGMRHRGGFASSRYTG